MLRVCWILFVVHISIEFVVKGVKHWFCEVNKLFFVVDLSSIKFNVNSLFSVGHKLLVERLWLSIELCVLLGVQIGTLISHQVCFLILALKLFLWLQNSSQRQKCFNSLDCKLCLCTNIVNEVVNLGDKFSICSVRDLHHWKHVILQHLTRLCWHTYLLAVFLVHFIKQSNHLFRLSGVSASIMRNYLLTYLFLKHKTRLNDWTCSQMLVGEGMFWSIVF